jgi:hypothetical protein
LRRLRDIFFEYTKINGERSKEKQGDVLPEPEEHLKEKEKAAQECMLDSFGSNARSGGSKKKASKGSESRRGNSLDRVAREVREEAGGLGASRRVGVEWWSLLADLLFERLDIALYA